jgi:hypothetical protein
VVDLPVPVEPVTSTMPWWKSQNFFTTGGRLSESSEGTSLGIVRKTAPTPVSLRNTLTRKRLPSSDTYDMSMSWPLRNCSWWLGVRISVT